MQIVARTPLEAVGKLALWILRVLPDGCLWDCEGLTEQQWGRVYSDTSRWIGWFHPKATWCRFLEFSVRDVVNEISPMSPVPTPKPPKPMVGATVMKPNTLTISGVIQSIGRVGHRRVAHVRWKNDTESYLRVEELEVLRPRP